MEPHTAQQVTQAMAELLTAQAAIDASNQVRAAAGLPTVPPPQPVDMTISAVAVKLPALWPDNPLKWFLHCEGKFCLHKITSQQAMFDHCIQAMAAEQSDVVMDLMEKGPSTTCYADLKTEYLKTAYIERRTPSTSERVQRLRKLGPLTSDKRPSDLLRLIERILGRAIDEDEIAKEEFLRRLPAQTQLVVRAQTDIFTVSQLAQMADRLISVLVMSQECAISQVELSRDEDTATLMSINQQLSRLTATNDRISGEVAELKRSSAFSQSGNRRSRVAPREAPRRVRMYRGINPMVCVGIIRCGALLRPDVLMAAVTRETAARVGKGDYRPAYKLMSPTEHPRHCV